MWNKVLLQLCACTCFIVLSNSQSCVNTGPSYAYGSINWQCKNITQTFPSLNGDVNSINCLECNIAILDESTITNFRGVTFDLSSSHIRKIAEGAFKTFTNITRTFILNNNEIEYMAPKVFSRFSEIDEISLKGNKISTLYGRVFEGTNLTKLDLSHNNFARIDSVFNGLKVTVLNLSSNGIKEIGPSAFGEVIFWKGRYKFGTQELDLSNNFLNTILLNTFNFPSKDSVIRRLYLQKNLLKVIENDTFLQLNFLWYLSLEDNRISQLYKNSFRGLSMLNALDFANNLLTYIPLGIFADLLYLTRLDLSQNHLRTFSANTFSGLKSLTKLNISHNDLQIVDDIHFLPIRRLAILDISDTKIHDLKLQEIIEDHLSLTTVVLHDNFWVCSKLVQMYKLMNRRRMGYISPSQYFDVPNLHGVACSREELSSYDNLTFQDFRIIISQDPIGNPLDSQDTSDPSTNNGIIADVRDISAMFIVITIIIAALSMQFVVKCVFAYFRNRKIVTKDKFSFLYTQNHNRVELLY
ncbi:hypothetical protein RI129_003533 [Pyrocoelia pectoralis]|uniref:Uncharacterized protein n=1 Tax=Pyrocoelia pectoralis TaxID=417401 RepID=A0AAN7VPN6_9COLE